MGFGARRRPERNRAGRAVASPPSASPIRVRPCWHGIAARADRSALRSPGRIGVLQPICSDMARDADELTRTTGLPLDPYFAAPKMTWLRRNVTNEGVVTTSDAWLLHRLTGAYVTDATTASRTLLLDLERRTWSREACAAFGLDGMDLPAVVGSAQEIGRTDAFGSSLPLSGLSVDQQAALVGEHCLEPGESKCTYGTGAFLLANAGPRAFTSSGGLAVSVAWQLGGRAAYCIDGQVYAAGAAVAWLQRWGFLRRAEDLDAVASSGRDSGGVTVVPALSGLGAPWWRPDALASIDGIGPATEPAHVVRATVEGLAAQVTLLARAAAVDLGRPARAAASRRRADPARGCSCRRRLICSRYRSRSRPPRTPPPPEWRPWRGSVPAPSRHSTRRSTGPTRTPAMSPPLLLPRQRRDWRASSAPWRGLAEAKSERSS